MALIELTTENFESTLNKDGITLIDWWAEWCGPCKRFGPIYEAAAARYPDVTFGKVDTEAQSELAGTFQIRSIPMLMVFRDQVLVYAEPGAIPSEALDEIIAKVKALDMAKVRKEVDEQEKNAGKDPSEETTQEEPTFEE
jgi:thioredoxin 1